MSRARLGLLAAVVIAIVAMTAALLTAGATGVNIATILALTVALVAGLPTLWRLLADGPTQERLDKDARQLAARIRADERNELAAMMKTLRSRGVPA